MACCVHSFVLVACFMKQIYCMHTVKRVIHFVPVQCPANFCAISLRQVDYLFKKHSFPLAPGTSIPNAPFARVGSFLSSKDMIRGEIPNCDLASHVITYWNVAMMNENTKILGAHVLLLQFERQMAEIGVAVNVMSVFDMILDNVLLPFAFPFSMHVHQWVLVPISVSTLTLYVDMFFMMKAFISLIAMV